MLIKTGKPAMIKGSKGVTLLEGIIGLLVFTLGWAGVLSLVVT